MDIEKNDTLAAMESPNMNDNNEELIYMAGNVLGIMLCLNTVSIWEEFFY